MSKYDPLWAFIRDNGAQSSPMSFGEIRDVLGFEIDHSFLTFKKELLRYGYQVGKISLKNRTISFTPVDTSTE